MGGWAAVKAPDTAAPPVRTRGGGHLAAKRREGPRRRRQQRTPAGRGSRGRTHGLASLLASSRSATPSCVLFGKAVPRPSPWG